MNRENALDIIYSCKTLAECQRAWEARSAYLREYPDDEEIFEAGESISMTEEALLLIQERERELVKTS